MKKSILIVVVITLLIVSCLFLNACNLFDFINDLSPQEIQSPSISIIGNTIIWDSVSGADTYDVYKDDELIDSTSNLYHIEENNSANAQFYVCSKESSTGKTSAASNKVIMYKQCDFLDSETMYISLTYGAGYVIPSNINHVYIIGSASGTYVEIANRTTDLVITLDNVNMTSSEGKHCIATQDGDYSTNNKHFSVTICVIGTNVLNGSDYYTVPSQPKENTETKGLDGGNGGSAIVLPSIVFVGDGIISLNGGNGGQGGEGADSSGFSTSRFGAGGNGGDGGNGICCTVAVMAMNITGCVKAFGGDSGDKGSPGVNGSVLSGPLYSSNYGDYYGNSGDVGVSLVGEMKSLRGTYMSE